MGKHGRNNCANPVFSYAERRMLKHWGTQKKRIGKDSIVDHDACSICLHQAVEPLCCHKGHLFCKGCIYEALLTQKQHIKKQTQLYEDHLIGKERKEKDEETKSQIKKMEEFAKAESSILPSLTQGYQATKQVASEKEVPPGYKAVKTERGVVYVPAEVSNVEERRKHMPCYWIPMLAPKAVETKVEKPNPNTVCPHGKHVLRLKQLKPVVWSIAETGEKREDKPDVDEGKFICPSCRKTLTKVMHLHHLRACGHVLCSTCVETVVKKEATPACLTCGTSCDKDDIVEMQHGGSNFAGNRSVVAVSTKTPSFQSF